MANFMPAGQIKIGRVPFDNSYQHTMTFGSVEDQISFFSSRCDQNLSRDDYTYVRMNNAIRVPFNAERLYTYNYCMYQNSNYGNKWFYAFIVGVNYVNENTTELVLELDVMQTWYFDYTLVKGFVEREHVNNDTIGAHLNHEPEMPFDCVVKSQWTDPNLHDAYIIVMTTELPQRNQADPHEPITPVPAEAGIFNRVFHGSRFCVFDVNDVGNGNPGQDVVQWLKAMTTLGAAEAITGMFMFPKKFIPDSDILNPGDNINAKVLANGRPARSYDTYTSRPSSLGGGYVPNNNKLFTFPYCYCMIDDNNGHNAEYRYEYWGGTSSGYKLGITSGVDPSGMIIVAPQNYNGVGNNVSEAFTFPYNVACSWTYSYYQNWLAQNFLGNAITAGTSIASLVVPATRGLSVASKALSYKYTPTLNPVKSSPLKPSAIVPSIHYSNDLDTIDKASMLGGAGGLAGLASNLYHQSKIPNIQKGSIAGNTLFANEYITYNVKQVVIREEWARIIDGFFDMYGYQVDSVKVPNRTGRPYWNYVKMTNACHRGNVPADDMAQINSIYNSGITFWHTADIGNYSLDNTL